MGDFPNFDKLVDESFFLDLMDLEDLFDLVDRTLWELVVLDKGAPSLDGELPIITVVKGLVLVVVVGVFSHYFSLIISPSFVRVIVLLVGPRGEKPAAWATARQRGLCD